MLAALPGYKGPDVYSRGERVEDHAYYFVDELAFQIYAVMRSLNAAKCRIRVHLPVLVPQLSQLEAACGGRLIDRSPSNQQAQQLTELGRELLRQADHHLGPNPESPPQTQNRSLRPSTPSGGEAASTGS